MPRPRHDNPSPKALRERERAAALNLYKTPAGNAPGLIPVKTSLHISPEPAQNAAPPLNSGRDITGTAPGLIPGDSSLHIDPEPTATPAAPAWDPDTCVNVAVYGPDRDWMREYRHERLTVAGALAAFLAVAATVALAVPPLLDSVVAPTVRWLMP